MPTDVIKALLPVLAAGFAVQRLLELLDPIVISLPGGEKKKKLYLGLLSILAGLGLAFQARLQVLKHLGVDTVGFELLDYIVTGLIISAGTDGVNSILKFLNYKKEEKKEEAKAEMAHAASARALLASRLSTDTFAATTALEEFITTGDLKADLTTALKDQMESRWPDQYKPAGWDERTFDAYVTSLQIGAMYDAVLSATNIVARAYHKQLSNQAQLRIQNRVKLDSNPKKILPVMENEVISA